MLHLVNQSPFQSDALISCLRVIADHDSLLLLENGVFAAINHTEFAEQLQLKIPNIKCYALHPDVSARGLEAKILPAIKLIDYDGFVELTVHCFPVQSWS